MKKYTILLLVCIWLIIPLHSEIVAPTEGHTQVFNVLGQGFFEGYYPITATCQKIGTSYYIFTEDVQVNDVSISPVDPNHLLIATSTGIYVSDDAGESWQFASGTGSDMLEPDYNGGSAANADAHRAPCLTSFYMKESEWWTGAESGAYQTKDGGESWSKKTRGLPNYVDENGEGVFPPFYFMMLDDQVTDYETNRDYWACSQAGLFYWSSSKFIDMGTGLPQTVSDWEHLAVYDFIKDDDQGYIATELGLYKGTINMDDNMVSWVPIGGADVTVTSSAYDSVLVIVLDGVTMNTYVNVVDESKSLYWRCKVEKSGDNLIVVINDENLYFSDEAVFDPATLDYSTYDASSVEVFQPANISISKLVKDDSGLLYYVVGTEIYKLDADSSELVYDAETGINDIVCHSGKMYIATTNGLFSANMDDLTTWTKETGLLTEGSTEGDSINYDVRAVEFDGNGNMYVGCHMGGLIRKEADTGEWTNLNLGLGHRAVLPEKVEYLSKAFDSLQVQSVLEDWFGELPDVDNDAKQYCLIVDLDDYYYLNAGDGASFIDGFFNPVDQLSKSDNINSNEMDIIYIDSNPLDLVSPKTWAAVVNALTVEIIQSKPVLEEEWVYRGLAEFGELLFGLKDSVSEYYALASNNSMVTIGDISPTVKDYDYCFTFFNYLYCHYFTDAAMVRAYVSLEETGMDGIDKALENIGGPSVKEVFNDYIMAVYFDTKNYTDATIPVKYKFPNIDVSMSPALLDYGFGAKPEEYDPTPNRRNQKNWSFYSFRINGIVGGLDRSPYFTKTMIFNGEDGATFNLHVVMQNTSGYVSEKMILDSKNIGIKDVSDQFGSESSEYQELFLVVTVHETPDVGGTAFILFDQSDPTEEFTIGFNHNIGAPDYLNIFCFTDYQMFDDAGKFNMYDSDGDGTADLEGPVGSLIVADDTTDLVLSQFYFDKSNHNYIYSQIADISNFASEAGSEVSITLVAENINSQPCTATADGVLAKLTKSSPQYLNLDKGSASISITEGSVQSNQTVTAFLASGNLAKQLQFDSEVAIPISDVLYMSDIMLEKPANVKLKLREQVDAGASELIPIVFMAKDGKLKAVARATTDKNGGIGFMTSELGDFQVFLAKENVLSESISPIPDKFALYSNYPNPFNSLTSIRYEIPRTSNVKILIFDLMGRQVKTLCQGEQNAGYYTVEWDGLDDDQRLLPSGVYFYRMVSSDFLATEKMIYLK